MSRFWIWTWNDNRNQNNNLQDLFPLSGALQAQYQQTGLSELSATFRNPPSVSPRRRLTGADDNMGLMPTDPVGVQPFGSACQTEVRVPACCSAAGRQKSSGCDGKS